MHNMQYMHNVQNMHYMQNMHILYNQGRHKLSDHLVLQMKQCTDIETGELNLTPLQVPSIS